jgi:hypothetical protein
MSDLDQLIDRFVEVLNSRPLEPLPSSEVPNELRTDQLSDKLQGGERSSADWVNWQIRPAASNPWVTALEQRIPYPFPKLHSSLITRYRFAEMEVGSIMFFANTGQDVFHELRNRMFADPHLSPVLLTHGLLHFGHPFAGNYDSVCFDTRRASNGDAPIVRIDHEDILIRNGRITIVEEIGPSLRNFIARVTDGEF